MRSPHFFLLRIVDRHSQRAGGFQVTRARHHHAVIVFRFRVIRIGGPNRDMTRNPGGNQRVVSVAGIRGRSSRQHCVGAGASGVLEPIGFGSGVEVNYSGGR